MDSQPKRSPRYYLGAAVLALLIVGSCLVSSRPAPPSPVAPAIPFGGAGAQTAPGPSGQPATVPSAAARPQPAVGFRAPEVIGRDVFTKEPVVLSSLKGQVVVLNFWATWCAPCKVEMPALEKLHQESKGRIRVLALGADSNETPEQMAQYARELNLNFSIVYDGGDATLPYQVIGIPTSYFIDRGGVIRGKYQGAMTIDQMREYAAEADRYK